VIGVQRADQGFQLIAGTGDGMGNDRLDQEAVSPP